MNRRDYLGRQVAGTAVLAAKSGTTPEDVPMDEIRALLREHAAIVPA